MLYLNIVYNVANIFLKATKNRGNRHYQKDTILVPHLNSFLYIVNCVYNGFVFFFSFFFFCYSTCESAEYENECDVVVKCVYLYHSEGIVSSRSEIEVDHRVVEYTVTTTTTKKSWDKYHTRLTIANS